MRKRAAGPAAPEGFYRHHFQRAQARIAGVVEQHRDIFVELLSEIEANLHVRGGIGVGKLDPRNTADDVSAKRHGLMHQLGGGRLAHDAILGEGHDLNVDDAAKFVADSKKRLDAL